MRTEDRPYLVLDTDAAIALARFDDLLEVSLNWNLVAPRLLWSEACNVLHRAMYRRRVTEGPERLTFERIVAGPIKLIDGFPPGMPWDIADLLGWSKTYDAEYLAVARVLGAGIFSFDRQLRSGARRLGIELVTPAAT